MSRAKLAYKHASKSWPDPAVNGRKAQKVLTNTNGVSYWHPQLRGPQNSGPQCSLPQPRLFTIPDPGSNDDNDDNDNDNDYQAPARKRQRQMDLDTQCLLNSSLDVSDDHGSSNDDELDTLPLVDKRYWRKKGMILGRCIEMWDTFNQILDEGVAHKPGMDQSFMFTKFENEQYKKFLLLIEVAPAMVKVLQRGIQNEEGPELAARLDRVIDAGRKQACQVDANGVHNAIGQWPSIIWKPAFPIVRHLLGFNHDTSGKLLCPITLNWDDENVRDSLHCGTQDITAADHPTFLWPKGVFHIDDIYKGFLHGELLVMAYKHIFISPSSAKETNKSMHGGNAELHNITFVTYQSVAYVATVTYFALSNELAFGPGGSDTNQRRSIGFPYRSFYRELLEHKELMAEDSLIDLMHWWNERIFPVH